jgi:hypothetical protein
MTCRDGERQCCQEAGNDGRFSDMYKSVICAQMRKRESARWAGERLEARRGLVVEFPTSEAKPCITSENAWSSSPIRPFAGTAMAYIIVSFIPHCGRRLEECDFLTLIHTKEKLCHVMFPSPR